MEESTESSSADSGPLDRAAAAGPMNWDDESADRRSASTPEAAAAHDSPASVDADRATGTDGDLDTGTSRDDAEGHDHMTTIYGPPLEFERERSGE